MNIMKNSSQDRYGRGSKQDKNWDEMVNISTLFQNHHPIKWLIKYLPSVYLQGENKTDITTIKVG